MPVDRPCGLPLTVRPAGWEPSAAQLAALVDFLLAVAKCERDRDAQRPAATTERAAGHQT
jgi:hypothetical protein